MEFDQTEEKEHRNLMLENDKSMQKLGTKKLQLGTIVSFPYITQANLKKEVVRCSLLRTITLDFGSKI